MRVLWFSVTPSLFNPKSNSHNGGGWIASLEQIVRKQSCIKLGIAFRFPAEQFRYDNDDVSYYPIPMFKSSILKRLVRRDTEDDIIPYYLKIIKDFNPDLIQIFGSENDFGLLCRHTSIPIVIHLQGCLPPYHNALFPVGMNTWDFIFTKGLTLNMRYVGLRSNTAFKRNAVREISIIQNCHYFMGRTEWDKGLVCLFNPKATYFHCEEALRDSFLNSDKCWNYPTNSKVKITSVISKPWYKGADLVLKTAHLIKQFTQLDFEWKIYGVGDVSFYENKYQINAKQVNVKAMGTVSKDELVDILTSTTLYVHPSYIDNSPNSVCEAQILGVPIIATNVGGLSSLIESGKTGFLVPANAPYELSNLICQLHDNRELLETISRNSIDIARKRHNPIVIGRTLLSIYNDILKC